GALSAISVRICEDIFIDRARAFEAIVEKKITAFRKDPSPLQQRSNFTLMSLDEPVVRSLVIARPLILHSVFFSEPLNLAVTKHRQTWQGCHESRYAEALISFAKLINSRAFIR